MRGVKPSGRVREMWVAVNMARGFGAQPVKHRMRVAQEIRVEFGQLEAIRQRRAFRPGF